MLLPGLVAAFKDQLAGALVWILAFSTGLTGYVWLYWDGALKEPGPDRDRLLGLLRRGGEWRWRYIRFLRIALDRVDRFLGDAGRPGLACRWLSGSTAWPCWTTWSFDRCTLIAAVYPVLGVFVTWQISGDAGDLGATLGFPTGTGLGGRIFSAACIAPVLYTALRLHRTNGRATVVWGTAYLIAVIVAGAVAVAGSLSDLER